MNIAGKIIRRAAAAGCAGIVIMLSGCGTKTNDKTADGKVKLSVGGWPTKEGRFRQKLL